MTAPLASGSISLRLYPHLDRPAPAVVDELTGQAALAAEHGFDGVMVSEHHAGFYGYVPDPQQLVGWCLESMASGCDGMVGDPAIAACATDPVPITSAVNSNTSVKRAARLGAGIIIDSLTAVDRCREIVSLYRASGGTGSAILIRQAWLGEPPRADLDRQMDVYKSYSSSSAMKHRGADEVVSVTDASEEAEKLLDALGDTGADALNIRVTVPGVGPEQVRQQIIGLGDDVLPLVRKGLGRD